MSYSENKTGNVKKRFKKTRKNNTPPKLYDVTEDFLLFNQKSGVRNCKCNNAHPIYDKFIVSDGKEQLKFICNVCKRGWYKYPDFSYTCNILGMKRSGKTTIVVLLSWIIHQIDINRRVVFYKAPQGLIDALHNVNWCKKYETICERALGLIEWSNNTPKYMIQKNDKEVQASFQKKEIKFKICEIIHNKSIEMNGVSPEDTAFSICRKEKCKFLQKGFKFFDKVDELENVKYNDVLIVDEAIINAGGGSQLSKGSILWGQLMVIMAHKRVILFPLFQRYFINKTMRETSEITIYKRLPINMIREEKRDPFLNMYRSKIINLDKPDALIDSAHHDFTVQGKLFTKMPEFYTEAISQSYQAETAFLDRNASEKAEINKAREIAIWYIEEIGGIIENSDDVKAVKGLIRLNFKGTKTAVVNKAIEQYYTLRKFGYEDGKKVEQREYVDESLEMDDNTRFMQMIDGIDQLEMEIFYHYTYNNRSMTSFNEEPYNKSKQRVSEIIRKVSRHIFKQLNKKYDKRKQTGEEAERNIAKIEWENRGYGLRGLGSGGERGSLLAPDNFNIMHNGKIRIIQVKERDFSKRPDITFSPMVANTELRIVNRLRRIAYNNKITCPHCLEVIKGSSVGGILTVDGAYLYVSGDKGKKFLKIKMLNKYNKKTIHVNWKNKVIEPQKTDLKHISNQKMKEFIESDKLLYTKNDFREVIQDPDEEITDNEEKMSELNSIEDLLFD